MGVTKRSGNRTRHRWLRVAALALVAAPLPTCADAPPNRPSGSGPAESIDLPANRRHEGPMGVAGRFDLAFADEFERSGLDRRWYPNRWFATDCSVGASEGEEQIYTSRLSNVSVSDGYLRLTARREPYRCAEWGATASYTSGWVQTGGSRDIGGNDAVPGFTCGVGCFVEVRLRMPPGGTTFPAVWLLPVETGDGVQGYPSRPEIDMIEFYRSWNSWEHHLHSHCDGSRSGAGHSHDGPDASVGFHTVAVWWRSPERIEWYVDGELSWTYTGCGIPSVDDDMYLILNHAVGGAAPSPDRDELFPKTMLVDYVRVWSS